jgi:hypothetical protein
MADGQECRLALIVIQIGSKKRPRQRSSRLGSIACTRCFHPTKKCLYDHNEPRLTADVT